MYGRRVSAGDARAARRGDSLRCALALGSVLLAVAAPAARVVAAGPDPNRPEDWTVRSPDLHGVASHGAHVWAVGYWGTVLRSDDAGASWQRATVSTHRTLFDVSFADERHGWAVGENGTVLRSVDGGTSWTVQPLPTLQDPFDTNPLDVHLFGVHAVSRREAWAVGDLGVVLHVRDGEQWEIVPIDEQVYGDDETPLRILNAVQFHGPTRGFIVGEFGTVLRTTDGGRSWTGERRIDDAPGDIYLFDVSVLDEQRAAAVGLAGMVLVTGDGGESWQPRETGVGSAFYGLAWGNPAGVAVGDRGAIRRTSDVGASWQQPEQPPLFNWLAAVSSAQGEVVFAVGERGVVLRSEDGGRSFSLVRGAAPQPLGGVSAPEPTGTGDLGVGVRRGPPARPGDH